MLFFYFKSELDISALIIHLLYFARRSQSRILTLIIIAGYLKRDSAVASSAIIDVRVLIFSGK
jgi:hypothetical protein